MKSTTKGSVAEGTTQILEKLEIETRSTSHKQTLLRIFSSQKFLVVILLVSVFDILLAATELTSDIMAIVNEREAVCKTDEILEILYSKHGGRLDIYFSNNSVDDILHDIRRPRRDVRDVLEIDQRRSTTEASTTIGRRPIITTVTDRANVETTENSQPVLSVTLFTVSHVFSYISTAIFSIMFVINIVRIVVLRKKFFNSKLQVLDALVIGISLPIDISLQPTIWNASYRTPMITAIPILFDVLSRSVRVVINSLINLHEQDKIQLVLEAEKLKESSKKYRILKRHARRLRELSKENGAEDELILACAKIVKTKRRKLKKTNLTAAIMSVNRLLFFGAPQVFPEPNQRVIDEEHSAEYKKIVEEDEETVCTPTRDITQAPANKPHRRLKSRSDHFSITSLTASAGSFESDDDGLENDDTNYDEHEGMESEGIETDEEDIDRTFVSTESVITYM